MYPPPRPEHVEQMQLAYLGTWAIDSLESHAVVMLFIHVVARPICVD